MATLPDNVVRLPGPDYNFKPYGLQQNQIIGLYDQNRSLVAIVERILAHDAAALKPRLPYLPEVIGRQSITAELISNIKTAAGVYEALGELFNCAAARLTAVEAKLV
jgi:hypothetical protein